MQKVEGFDRFLSRVAAANRSRSRDILLSLEEANELHGAITKLILKQNQIMLELAEAKKVASVGQEIVIRGGSFK